MKKFFFDMHVEVDNATGRTLAVYFQVRKGRATKVLELADGNAFANYGARGQLLGIELLAPCKVNVLDQVASKEPKEVQDFIRQKIPQEMAVA